jgi:hypothetical protein
MSDTNIFGGKNVNSLYVPMTETEQEFFDRLFSSDDLEIRIQDWGYVSQFRHILGDLRVSLHFNLAFQKPEGFYIPVSFLTLQLAYRDGGEVLYEDTLPTMINNKPLQVTAGMCLDLAWDIAVQNVNRKWIKKLMPKHIGLTTRRGNMDMTPEQRKQYNKLEQKSKEIREYDQKKIESLKSHT